MQSHDYEGAEGEDAKDIDEHGKGPEAEVDPRGLKR
jgi:hypothetical protein